MSVARAVAYLVVPTVLTQLISILYNFADTFFIGQLTDPTLVAAVGVCLPPMMFMTAIANLFGVGASSAISRALGRKDENRARLSSSFSFWCGLAVAAIYILATIVFHDGFIHMIGGNDETYVHISKYLFITMTCGGLVFFLASLLAHFLRTLGKSVVASVGVSGGAVLNIVLDPLFLFVFGWGIEGVAFATLLGQIFTVAVLAIALVICKGEHVICPVPSMDAFRDGIGREIVQIGFVSFCMTALAQVSNTVVNILVSPYGAAYLAASTVAIKINIATFSIAQGLTVSVVPLIGFNYAAGNATRVKETARIMVIFAVAVTSICMVLTLMFPREIIAFFINDPVTIANGTAYVQTVAFSMIPSSLVFAATMFMQAIGQKKCPYILAFTRMGTVDVVFMVICNMIFGAPGVLIGKPISDWLCVLTACVVLNNLRKHTNPFADPHARDGA